MFDPGGTALPFSEAGRAALRRAWAEIGAPGAFWSGEERRAIAQLARAQRLGTAAESPDLPPAAVSATSLLAATPGVTTRSWVQTITSELGEERYVELTGIVSRVVGIDTVTRLLGSELEPLPAARPGRPSGERTTGHVEKGRAWVHMEGMALPPNVLSLVPAERVATNDLLDHLYMTDEQMNDPDLRIDGLHRTQIELVAATTSHGNECFY